MNIRTQRIRIAEPGDAAGISRVHDASWFEAYRGIIPEPHLSAMISRRGSAWWRTLLRRTAHGGTAALVLDFEDKVAGYATFGRSRAGALPYRGEIFEIYLSPEFQGLGFGRRLFRAARQEMAARSLTSTIVWVLEPNERAIQFYNRLGGRMVASIPEQFGQKSVERLAFGWG